MCGQVLRAAAVALAVLVAACGGVVSAPDAAPDAPAADAEPTPGDARVDAAPADASPECPPIFVQPGSCAACCQDHMQADDAGVLFCPYCHIQTITGANIDRPGYCANQPCCDGVYTGVCP